MTLLYFFKLLGSACAKATRRTLVKLTPGLEIDFDLFCTSLSSSYRKVKWSGVNFTKILRAAFGTKVFCKLISTYSLVWLCIFCRKNIDSKTASKMLIKLTTGNLTSTSWVDFSNILPQRGRFHHQFTQSFYKSRSQKCKKVLTT